MTVTTSRNSFTTKKDSTLPDLEVQLTTSDGTPIDLTATTVTLRMAPSNGGDLKIDANCIVTDAANGLAKYKFDPADVDTPGNYLAEFVLTSAGGVQIAPSNAFLNIVISGSLT